MTEANLGQAQITIGESVKIIRRRKKMTQATLAEKSGLSRKTVVTIENDAGNVTMDTMQAIFLALGYRMDVKFTPAGIETKISEEENGKDSN